MSVAIARTNVVESGASLAELAEQAGVDGVICFGGGDWWYHNRGHYDMQMMREFSEAMPVLYVNSIGIRTPKLGEGAMFLTRVRRKLRSLRRGFVRVRKNWGVVSPFVVPGRIAGPLTRPLLAPQVRRCARKMGMRKPLVWVTCPPAARAVDKVGAVKVAYQRTDRWEEFPHANKEEIRAIDRFLKQRADVTLFCSTLLFDEEGPACRNPVYLDHGVDFEAFRDAGAATGNEPEDVAAIARPRVGFIGGIDSHTFDADLFRGVAERVTEAHFVLVGACSLPEGWCSATNVHLLGQRPYEDVARYMAACDVLIMPWNQNEWIRACNPVKLKEYLATGRPVVSTPFPELERYGDLVRRAVGADNFAQAVREAIADPGDANARIGRAEGHSWGAKARGAFSALTGQADSRSADSGEEAERP